MKELFVAGKLLQRVWERSASHWNLMNRASAPTPAAVPEQRNNSGITAEIPPTPLLDGGGQGGGVKPGSRPRTRRLTLSSSLAMLRLPPPPRPSIKAEGAPQLFSEQRKTGSNREFRFVLAAAAVLLLATPAAAEPVPYAQTVAPRANWRDKAGDYLTGQLPADDSGVAKAVTLNNYWAMRQDPKHPWKGTPRADGFDGNSDGTFAVFSDPRFSARAIAIELRDFQLAGVVSANDVAARLDPQRAAQLAQAMAQATGRGPGEPMGLFGDDGPTPRLRAVMRALAAQNLPAGMVPNEQLIGAGIEAVAYDRFDQSAEGFARWRAASPDWRPQVERFEAYLSTAGLSGRFPLHQVLRTATDWKGCGAPFTVPPEEYWPNAVRTLRLIDERIRPAMPGLEIMSGYRPGWLNVCAGGAARSAHREFLAFDMVPGDGVDRDGLMLRVCPVYATEGPQRAMGLGFYSGVRFHIDTMSFRTWASKNRVAYAPCTPDGAVNPVPDIPPPPPPWPPVYPSR